MPAIEHHSFQHGALRVHYRSAGQGQPVVLLHGGGSRAGNFDPVIDALAACFRVHAYDLRGFGATGAAADEVITHQLWAQDLIAFLDHLDLDSAFVCGWSLGTAVAMNAAGQWPGRIRALCLLGAPSPDRAVNHALHRERLADRPPGDILAESFAKVPAMLAPRARRPEILEVIHAEYLANAPFAPQVTAAYLTRPPLAPVVAAVTCPVTVVVGEYDTVNDLAGAQALHAALADSVLEVVSDCGHYYALEQPAVVAAIIARAFRL